MTKANNNQPTDEVPPIFSSWNYLYAIVLIMHTIIIMLFYLFTKHFS